MTHTPGSIRHQAREQSAAAHSATPDVCPCVWMTAGVLAYRLCDRDLDCDRCALDAALRGSRPAPADVLRNDEIPGGALDFPDDRLYAAGHLWVQTVAEQSPAEPRVRIGLDPFAAALCRRARRFVTTEIGSDCALGDQVGELDFEAGVLPLRAPVAGTLRACNPTLDGSLRALVESPLSDGWLLEFSIADSSASAPNAKQGRRLARLDLRRFGRLAAMDLLTATPDVGATLPDGGQPLTDLHTILGGLRYLQLLKQLIG